MEVSIIQLIWESGVQNVVREWGDQKEMFPDFFFSTLTIWVSGCEDWAGEFQVHPFR